MSQHYRKARVIDMGKELCRWIKTRTGVTYSVIPRKESALTTEEKYEALLHDPDLKMGPWFFVGMVRQAVKHRPICEHDFNEIVEEWWNQNENIKSIMEKEKGGSDNGTKQGESDVVRAKHGD